LDNRNPSTFKRPADRVHFTRPGGDLKNFFFAGHVGGASVERLAGQAVSADLVRVPPNKPLRSDHPAAAPQSAPVAPEFFKGVPDLGGGAVPIIREYPDHDGDAAWGVALVRDLLVRLARKLPGSLLDGALDVVLGHVRLFGRLDGGLEAHVGLGIAAAIPGGDRDLAQDLREQLPTLNVGLALLTLDLRPPGMP